MSIDYMVWNSTIGVWLYVDHGDIADFMLLLKNEWFGHDIEVFAYNTVDVPDYSMFVDGKVMVIE